MSEQRYDFFGEIFQRYFRPAIDAYPRMGAVLVERLLTLSDDVPDRLTQTRCAATAWAKAETQMLCGGSAGALRPKEGQSPPWTPNPHPRPRRNRRGCTSRPRTWTGTATRI